MRHETAPVPASGADRQRSRRQRLSVLALTTVALLGSTAAARAQSGVLQQTFTLHPGWNSIYLEVQPEPDDMDSNFAALPVASVWTWIPPASGNQFVQNPSDGLLDLPGWLGYFPRQLPEHFLTNLFALQANHPYLIKLAGTASVQWTVSGRPALAPVVWQADSFNLKGFPIDPANPPSFGAFFAGAPAHAGQPVYSLAADGTWQLITDPFSTPIQSGVAYWVYSNGSSTFRAPLDVSLDLGTAVDFGAGINNQDIEVHNTSSVDADLVLQLVPGAGPLPLAYRLIDEASGEIAWPDFPSSVTLPTPAGHDAQVTLGVRRAAMTAERMDSVLQITDGLGSRILLAVGANTVQPLGATTQSVIRGRARTKSLAKGTVSTPFAGLWVGEVQINAVSEGQRAGTVPTPTGKPFPLRVLLHVDGNGNVKVLKAVIQMWQDGTMAPDPANPSFLITTTPGHYVLITDDSLIQNFSGAGLRDGEPVGLRISTTSYDFPGQSIDATGSVGPGGSLTWTMVLDSNFPTNPFLHRYHPDHDNLDAQFLNPVTEAYAVTRIVQMSFTASDPTGENPPEWGSSKLGGTYSEEITGLHKNRIFVSGTFRMQRVAATPVLNQ